jgi:hypothetical protein
MNRPVVSERAVLHRSAWRRTGFGMPAPRCWGLVVVLAVGTLLPLAMPGTTSAKATFTSFAEASFVSTDAAGVETRVEVQAIDRPTGADQMSLEVNRSDPACAAPAAGCTYVLLAGYVSEPVAERDVRIQPNVRWARVATTITFVDDISGTSCAATINLIWRATGPFAPDGADGSGFRQADAAGTVTCAGEEFLGGQVGGSAEISRFILAG